MDQRGERLFFSEDERRISTLPESAPIADAAQIRAKVSAQLAAITDRAAELTANPIRSSHGARHELNANAQFIGGIIRQLDNIIDPSPTAGVNEELRRLIDNQNN